MTASDLFDQFENLSKEGEFISFAEPLYFKNWTPEEMFEEFTTSTQFRCASGHRMFGHGTQSLGYIHQLLSAGAMNHPKGEEILALLQANL